jgi:hypothetical protein
MMDKVRKPSNSKPGKTYERNKEREDRENGEYLWEKRKV